MFAFFEAIGLTRFRLAGIAAGVVLFLFYVNPFGWDAADVKSFIGWSAANGKVLLFFIALGFGALGLFWFFFLRPRTSADKQLGILRRMKGGSLSTGTHGSADFCSSSDLKKFGLAGEEGFILGRFASKFIRFSQPGHLITFAPTRSGKGVGQVIPNLLDHPGSVVVNDIKGENYAVSGRHRASFGGVYTFAPFNEVSNCFNPIEFIRVGTQDELDDAALIADMIIVEENAKDPFWDREAKNLVLAMIMHVATAAPPALRNMGEVRYLLMQSRKDFDMTVKEMMRSKNAYVRKAGGAISAMEPKVLASVLSTAKSQTAVWDSPRLQAITSKSDFNLAEIKEKVTSFYIIIPPEYLDVYKPIVRLMMAMTLATMTRTKGKPKTPVLFLIDEFPALGYMKNIEVGIGYLAGYGASLWLFIQDLNQLKDNYPKWGTFLANCAVRVAFGTNDFETAKMLSDMLGTTTVTVESTGISRDKFQIAGGNRSTNTSETGRPLMTPDEVMRIPNDSQVIFVQGVKPILAEKIFYFRDKFFRGKFDNWDG